MGDKFPSSSGIRVVLYLWKSSLGGEAGKVGEKTIDSSLVVPHRIAIDIELSPKLKLELKLKG